MIPSIKDRLAQLAELGDIPELHEDQSPTVMKLKLPHVRYLFQVLTVMARTHPTIKTHTMYKLLGKVLNHE